MRVIPKEHEVNLKPTVPLNIFLYKGSNNPHFLGVKKFSISSILKETWNFFTLEMHVFFNQEYYFCNTLGYHTL